MKNNEYMIQVENVSKSYSLADKQVMEVLSQINLGIREGEFIALLGQSGSGKSTLLRIMAGLIPPTSGTVYSEGAKLSGINESMSIVFQSFALFPWLTVADNVRVGLNKRKLSREEEDREIERALAIIGLGGHENAYPKELSGGMRQRVGFARALVARPDVLAMDEPFSALDVLTAKNLRAEIIDLWSEKKESFKSAFMVTHNISEAVAMASKIMILSSNPGKVMHNIINPLPYPRDEKSPEFMALVDQIHDLITVLNLPEVPPREEVHRRGTVASSRIESLPAVDALRVLGFLELLQTEQGSCDIFVLTQQMREEFGSVIAIAKAAEILGFVTTPEHDVVLTALGRKLVEASAEERMPLFRKAIQKLGLFRKLEEKLAMQNEVSEDEFKLEIQADLPYENADKMIDTIVDWGRYAAIFEFDAAAKVFTKVRT